MSRFDVRVVVAVAVVALSAIQIGSAGVAVYWRRSAQAELEREQQRLHSLQQRLAESDAAIGAPDEPEGQVRWQLLDTADVVTTLQVLQRVGDAAGISFDDQKAERSSNPGKQPFLVSGRGTPDQFTAFVAAIEEHERLIVIETGRVLPLDSTQIAFELGLATYYRGGPR